MQHQLFHSPMGTKLKIWSGPGAAMMLDHSLHVYGDEDTLASFFADLEPGKEYDFFGVPAKMLPLLEGHFNNIQRHEECSAYTITREDFVEDIEHQESLSLNDAEFVNEHWTYKFDGSLDFFKQILTDNPSSAIRVNGQLAGWSVCYDSIEDMVNLGSLRVLEQYRKQGLGKKLAIDLVDKVLKTGKTPMVHIVDSNLASKTLSMGIGFKPHPEKIFWGTGVKK